MHNNKRHLFFIPFIIVFFCLSIGYLYYLNVYKRDYYLEAYDKKMNRIVSGSSAPRGRILDRNGNILVDNVGVRVINYTKLSGITTKDELEIAMNLANIIELEDSVSELAIKRYWLLLNEEAGKKLITPEEYELLEYRKLTNNDIYQLKLSRIPTQELEKYDEVDIKAAGIYELMNRGYRYQTKTIKSKNVTDSEIAKLSENPIKGITLELTWDRIYPYGNTLRSVFGSISSEKEGIPAEQREYFLELGYSLNERVGISYLEKQYEEYLRGEKDLYFINPDNTLTLHKEGRRGNDLVLSIDIYLQIELEKILMNNIREGKKHPNTEYFNHGYIIISEPTSGSIIAMVGSQLTESPNGEVFTDITTNIISSSYPMGSIVKGASQTVGFQHNLIEIGKHITDSCVKLYKVPAKCSWRSLGPIDDIKALQHSSNYYQFLLAIELTGKKYYNNMQVNPTREHFDIYRNTFASFGLGVKTGIDLPNEKIGVINDIMDDDVYLLLSIGQFDTYTPIQVVQYINTIANDGARVKPSLMLQIIDYNGNVIKRNEGFVTNNVDLSPENFKRVQEGLRMVIKEGTGYRFINQNFTAAGKTGTGDEFLNRDGLKKMINSTFGMYTPFENPKYSMVVITPHVSHRSGSSDYTAPINRIISREVSDFLLENY